jgi:hypothetical protein
MGISSGMRRLKWAKAFGRVSVAQRQRVGFFLGCRRRRWEARVRLTTSLPVYLYFFAFYIMRRGVRVGMSECARAL